MIEHGRGQLSQKGQEIVASGFAHQCSKCKMDIVSDDDPEQHGLLGNYGIEYVGWTLLTSYTMTNPDSVGYNTSTSPTIAPWDSYVWY
ncbi:hypothetical protein [Oceanobacillus massiliensis]|uniref:hypothetical protein n=1 Tax=Oceanobacillus massiliensis TaxID=1465765 RepID=UPI000289ECF4|nr:hypothetical protein [Oceanobacillus massiliensis]